MNFSLPPSLFDPVYNTSIVRSIGAWDAVNGARTGGNIPLPDTIKAGNILLVFGASRESTTIGPTNGGWTQIDTQTGLTNAVWSRYATADTNDNFTAPSLSDLGQQQSAYQMLAISIPMASTPIRESSNEAYIGAFNAKMLGASLTTTVNTDRLIVSRTVKLWDPLQFSGDFDGITNGVTADGMEQVDILKLNRSTSMTLAMAWSVRFDATGASVTEIDYNQNPDNANGGLYSETTRCVAS